MVQVPSPFSTGSPTTTLSMVRMGNGAQAMAGADSPLTVRDAAFRKPVPVSDVPSVQSDDALVAGARVHRDAHADGECMRARLRRWARQLTMAVLGATPVQPAMGVGEPQRGRDRGAPGHDGRAGTERERVGQVVGGRRRSRCWSREVVADRGQPVRAQDDRGHGLGHETAGDRRAGVGVELLTVGGQAPSRCAGRCRSRRQPGCSPTRLRRWWTRRP